MTEDGQTKETEEQLARLIDELALVLHDKSPWSWTSHLELAKKVIAAGWRPAQKEVIK